MKREELCFIIVILLILSFAFIRKMWYNYNILVKRQNKRKFMTQSHRSKSKKAYDS